MPTDTQRAPSAEEWKAVGREVRDLAGDYGYVRSTDSGRQAADAAYHALIIAIAKRVREARAETCGHDPKNLGTARITDTNGRVRWATICTACECIISDPEAPHA